MKSPCYLVTLSLESSDFQKFLKQYVILVLRRFDFPKGTKHTVMSAPDKKGYREIIFLNLPLKQTL